MSQKTMQPSTVQGVAAAGNPISGTVYLCYSSSFTRKVSAKTTDAGEFSIDITGLTPPFLLKTVDRSNNILFSYANGPGTANINPLTTVAVAVAAGATDNNSLTTLYNNHNLVVAAAATITSSLHLLLEAYGAENSNFLSGPYVVNHQGLDALFDTVAIAVSDGHVAITRKDNGSQVFSAPLSNLMSGIVANIPAPTAYDLPGNAALTLKMQGGLPPGTLLKNVSFSVQLPLGVTVVTTPAVESGPAVLNTTIPFGTAADAGANSAATLAATNGMLNITLSSVAGFGTGDFLTIRYTDSSPYFMSKRTPADFVISGSAFFSDIYKSQKLQNLTIVPDRIAYP